MATNVTQKDQTLQQIIDWCISERNHADEVSESCDDNIDWAWNDGKSRAFQDVIDHCKDMLGYGGSMPLEVPNQAEDAKK